MVQIRNATTYLERVLRLVFRQQAAEAARTLSLATLRGDADVPRLDYWPEQLLATVRPLVVQLYQQGITESRRRLAILQGGRPVAAQFRWPQRITPHIRHTFGAKLKQLGVSFDLFDPLVLRAIDKATLQFCEETNATAVGDLKTAVAKLRKLLKEGLPEGKAVAQLAHEVKRIFADPSRAWRIAATESSRAVHGGALLNAKESSLKLRKEWLASSDACHRCLELDGVQKELDEPFVVDGVGPYARIDHPPLHPHCFCSFTEVLA